MTRRRPLPAIALLLLLPATGAWPAGPAAAEPDLSPAAAGEAEPAAPEVPASLSLEVVPPELLVAGIPGTLTVKAGSGGAGAAVRVRTGGRTLTEATLSPEGTATIALQLPGGAHRLVVEAARDAAAATVVEIGVRAIPGWLTLVPPLLAIALALLFRQVVPALLTGIWVGAWIVTGGPLDGFLRTLDRFLLDALADRDHISIVMFSLLLGGMVGIVTRAGGTAGLVESLSRRATNTRRGQLITWVLGLVIFFDDYTNTLVVGNTMRPVTDRLRISREKLAYIVDSTAAPVAAVAIISTWIGFEVSLIADTLSDLGSTEDAYWVFLQSIPYMYYPLLALVLGFLVSATDRDFGPMLRAERRAARGRLVADGAAPLSEFDHAALAPEEGKPHRWANAVIPVLVVLAVTFFSQFLSGRAALAAAGDPMARTPFLDLGLRGFGQVFAAGDSFRALLVAASCGCLAALVLAVSQRVLRMEQGVRAWIEGMKTMYLAIIVLALAWAIGDVCRAAGTDDYLVSVLSESLDPRWLPFLVFLLASIISFATGSSWSTMSILVPLAVPGALGMASAAGYDAAATHHILLGAVSSVLAGAIFGDHCSPISDTTVMSSMASGCDHVDHVRTQLPYAILVAVVAVTVGEIPTGFGMSPWVPLLAGSGVLAAVLLLRGRKVSEAAP